MKLVGDTALFTGLVLSGASSEAPLGTITKHPTVFSAERVRVSQARFCCDKKNVRTTKYTILVGQPSIISSYLYSCEQISISHSPLKVSS